MAQAGGLGSGREIKGSLCREPAQGSDPPGLGESGESVLSCPQQLLCPLLLPQPQALEPVPHVPTELWVRGLGHLAASQIESEFNLTVSTRHNKDWVLLIHVQFLPGGGKVAHASPLLGTWQNVYNACAFCHLLGTHLRGV